MTTLYCISGLGADERVFQKLDLSPYKVIHLAWKPFAKGETVPEYAKRFVSEIDTSEDFAILGLSFGGMVGTELAKLVKPKWLILMSSIALRSELPIPIRAMGHFGLRHLMPYSKLLKPNKKVYEYFGTKTPDEQAMLRDILADTDLDFLKWAMGAVMKWQNAEALDCIRIHGDDDNAFPKPKGYQGHVLKGGGHFAILSHADEVSEILHREIS